MNVGVWIAPARVSNDPARPLIPKFFVVVNTRTVYRGGSFCAIDILVLKCYHKHVNVRFEWVQPPGVVFWWSLRCFTKNSRQLARKWSVWAENRPAPIINEKWLFRVTFLFTIYRSLFTDYRAFTDSNLLYKNGACTVASSLKLIC